MNEIRGYNYRIEPRDVDFSKHSTVMALGDYILHVAGEDADRNGFGVRHLNEHNASWVLTRMAMEVYEMPAEYDDIRITTWVSDVSRVMTTRNFEVFDSRGAKIASAITNWAMIDLTARRALDLHTLPQHQSMVQNIEPPMPLPTKIAPPDAANTYKHRVVYSDIDFNCHTNSMKYLQWVVDTLPIKQLEEKRFSRVDINFLLESRHGDLLKISTNDTGIYEITSETGKPCCRIAISME